MSDISIYKTDYLYPNPSFLLGMGSILNLKGGYVEFNISETPEEADYNAIMNDWLLVGSDLRYAINKFESETNITDGKKSTNTK